MYVPPDDVQDLGEINMSFDREGTARSTGAKVVAHRNPVYDNQQYVGFIDSQ